MSVPGIHCSNSQHQALTTGYAEYSRKITGGLTCLSVCAECALITLDGFIALLDNVWEQIKHTRTNSLCEAGINPYARLYTEYWRHFFLDDIMS